jgi:hypothetical protein
MMQYTLPKPDRRTAVGPYVRAAVAARSAGGCRANTEAAGMSSRIEGTAGEPRTVDEARDAVERSRQRISSTLDELEGRIVEKKHAIEERIDVLRPVRQQIAARPFTALAVAAGVGVLLGSVGGSDDGDDVRRSRSGRTRGSTLSDEDRRELREWRKARRQRLSVAAQHHDDDDEGDSRFDALKHQLMGALTSAITAAVTSRVRRIALDNVGGLVDRVTGGDGDHRHAMQERDARESGRPSYR